MTCAEDIDRIDPDLIEALTKETFYGGGRVRAQMAICDFWPRSDLPANFGDPVTVPVPTLLLSGRYDPVTSPYWGELAARNLPKSLHIVAPGSHGVGGSCITSITREFIESGDVENVDTSCVNDLRRTPYRLPGEK